MRLVRQPAARHKQLENAHVALTHRPASPSPALSPCPRASGENSSSLRKPNPKHACSAVFLTRALVAGVEAAMCGLCCGSRVPGCVRHFMLGMERFAEREQGRGIEHSSASCQDTSKQMHPTRSVHRTHCLQRSLARGGTQLSWRLQRDTIMQDPMERKHIG